MSIFSFVGIFLVLYLHFGSGLLALQVMLNIPLALIGSVVAIYLTGGITKKMVLEIVRGK